ncbi:Bystin-domain-containing protein [Massariosphaeria phaeospora]|uniref:Bystin-domain-containing protein n=1 Tax=Massariosphaeria phaeospora TaxID=100035 RepID=A0A7C8MBR2_9PLEO|nr:Bystin-domain-containing protein [Massariosphaeria phaeospora]
MPKTPKSPAHEPPRHNPLVDDYVGSSFKQKRAKKRSRDEKEGEDFVDSKSSKRILELGRELAEEDEQRTQRPPATNSAFDFDAARIGEDDGTDETGAQYDDDEAWGDEEDEVEEVEIDPNDLATFNKFIPTDDNPIVWPGEEAQPSGPGTDLAALILEKIAAHETRKPAQADMPDAGDVDGGVELPTKVIEVYSQIGLLLSRYKSGKIPKAVKILPTIPAWETLIDITRPENWTPNAVFGLTRIFISSKPYTAQRFLNLVLLPSVQENIRETTKLNIHLYNALKKALYKPSAFFKGVIFPMLADGTCTQREAHIVASVVAKVSVPVLHSAAALHRLCELAAEQMSSDPDAAGPVNIFIHTLLCKKYALPYKVIDALVFHFLRFRAVINNADAMDTGSVAGDLGGTGKLPVIWHQCLLAFAQRYRNDITEDQREAMLDLLLTRGHKNISAEVRRELLEGRGRGVVVELSPVGMDGDDTMVMG